MEIPWIIKNVAESAASDTVIVVISNRRLRRQTVEQFGMLGDRVIDFFDQSQLYAVEDFFNIPHRLMVLHYPDYKKISKAIAKHLEANDANQIPPILVFGRWWRKLPNHPNLIDGDNTTPDALYRMYWEARGKVFNESD
jgi:hypothetical protein